MSTEKISPEDEAVAQQIMREHFPNDWMDQKHLTAAIATALRVKGETAYQRGFDDGWEAGSKAASWKG